MMNREKRIKALEQKTQSTPLLFPAFLLAGIPDPFLSFHDSGRMGRCCTMNEAFQAIISGSIYELIQTKYRQYEQTETN